MLVRSLDVGNVLLRGGCGGRVNRRCASVRNVRRHWYGAVIGDDQATKKRGEGSNISQRRNHLPLGAGGDLGNGAFALPFRGVVVGFEEPRLRLMC